MSPLGKATGEDLGTLKTSIGELKDAAEQIKTNLFELTELLKAHVTQSNNYMVAIQEKLDDNVSNSMAKAEEKFKEYQEKLENLSVGDESSRNALEWIAQSRQSQQRTKHLGDARRVLPEIVKALSRASREELSFGVIDGTDKKPICLYFYFKEDRRMVEISDTAGGIKLKERGQDAKDITDEIPKIVEGIDVKQLDDENDRGECERINQKFLEHMKRWLT